MWAQPGVEAPRCLRFGGPAELSSAPSLIFQLLCQLAKLLVKTRHPFQIALSLQRRRPQFQSHF